jgi:four helix bundle protein
MDPEELESRLVSFSLTTVKILNYILRNELGNHLSKQLGHSGTSVSLNYGEARGAESRKDFIHKMKIVLKELRETHICLRLIQEAQFYRGNDSELHKVIAENNELISIFVSSIATAQRNGTIKNCHDQDPNQKSSIN